MMYNAKIYTFPFKKNYKCKGHTILNNGYTMLILIDEKRVFVPNKYIIEFDDGWFKMELQNIKKTSNGNAVINHDLKG